MDEINSDSPTRDQKQTSIQDEGKLANLRRVECLVHTCTCKDAACKFRGCQKMRNLIRHFKRCNKQKINRGCPLCKSFYGLCCLHAQICQETGVCPIPFCIQIKNKKLKNRHLRKKLQQAEMKTHQLQKILEQVLILRKHVTNMQNRRMFYGLHKLNPENSNSSTQTSTHHLYPSFCTQPGTGMKPSSGLPIGALLAVPQIPDTGMKPSSGPSIGALLAVQQIQIEAVQQAAQAHIQNALSQMSGIPNFMLITGNVAPWENFGYVQNYKSLQNTQPLPNPELGLQQSLQIMKGIKSEFTPIDLSVGSSQIMPNAGPSVDDMQSSTQDWQQLFQKLKISSTSSVDDMQSSTQDWQQLFKKLRISSTSSPPPSF